MEPPWWPDADGDGHGGDEPALVPQKLCPTCGHAHTLTDFVDGSHEYAECPECRA